MPIKNYPIRLQAISMFLQYAYKSESEIVQTFDKTYTEEEWDEFGEAEQDNALDTLLDYQGIITRTVIYELNALVEYELVWIAKVIRRKNIGKSLSKEKNIKREKAREIIEKEYNIDLQSLPGFALVEEVRKIANAYKHDDGFSGQYELPFKVEVGYEHLFKTGLGIEKRHELDIEKAETYIDAVRKFLGALPAETLNLGDDIRMKLE